MRMVPQAPSVIAIPSVTYLHERRLYDVGDPLGGRDKGTLVERRGRKATGLTQKFCYAGRVTERVFRSGVFDEESMAEFDP